MPGPRRLLLALPLVLLAGAAHAADPALERRLQDLLWAYEDTPTPEQLQALGPETTGVLRAWAADTSRPFAFRGRAVHALGAFPVEGNRSLLLLWAHDSAQNGLLRRMAIQALANGWGDAAAADIAPFLSDPDVQNRITAVHALGRLSDPVRKPLLQARLGVETQPVVTSCITQVLATDPE